MICQTCGNQHITEHDVLRCRIVELEKQLAAVREVIAEKLMMEWATHSGEPPMDVKDVLEDVRKAAIGEVES